MRKVLISAHKGGFLYVLDRTTGKPIAANPYVRVSLGVPHRSENRPPGVDRSVGARDQG